MGSRPFVVPVLAILRSGELRRVAVAGPIDGLVVSGSEVPRGEDVAVDVLLEPLGATIEAVGTVSAPWTGECRRCLRPVRSTLRAAVREIFEEHPVVEETYPLQHGEVDLEPMAREAVMLELPQAPLCREDCLGLCPTCGVDRNEGSCDCAPAIDPRWAVLDRLRRDE